MVRALGIVGIVGYLGSLGLTQVTVRHAAAEPERESEWFGALIGFRMVLLVPVLVVVLGVEILNARGHEMLVAAIIPDLSPAARATDRARKRVLAACPQRGPGRRRIGQSILWTGAVGLLFVGDRGLVAYAAARPR